tara:strand:- start:4321 stop:5574 length:1254 start_codon:yes stop_codon:yes gene_type:complete
MIIKRGKTFLLRRRVPSRYAAIEARTFVKLSLHTDSEMIAREKAARVWVELIDSWEARRVGANGDADAAWTAARDLAAARGFRFRQAEDVAKLPVDQLLSRVEAVPVRDGVPDPLEARAVLGGAQPPQMTISSALELYWSLAREKTLEKSPDQIRRWRNPHIKAINNLIGVIGDVPINQISHDDMQDFREWWLDRIADDGIKPHSANKDFTYIATVLRTVASRKRLGFVPPVAGLAFKEGKPGTRPPYSTEWIRTRLLPGLSGLNADARRVVLSMVNTGMRLSEAAALHPHHIDLTANVPHVLIRGEGRQLKSHTSEREIPLAGVSLEALREGGLSRYHDKPGLSATINKFLSQNGLQETPDHTIYGLRHSFEDRLLTAGVDERVRRDLMGHALGRQRYGEGGGLPAKLAAVQLVAL